MHHIDEFLASLNFAPRAQEKHVRTSDIHLKAGAIPHLRSHGELQPAGRVPLDTAQLALRAAETGHLVFATLHARDGKGAVSRLIDLVPGDQNRETASQLSQALAYVISQRLVEKRDGGRCIAMEVLRNTTGVAQLIRSGQSHQLQSMIETQSREGMWSLQRHLLDLVQAGTISRDEASRHVPELR